MASSQTSLKIRLNSKLLPILRHSLPLLFCFVLSISNAVGQEIDEPVIYPSDSAEAWLNKMATAVSHLNYKISFVLLKPGLDSQPYLWRHGIDASGLEMEQLELLNGPGRSVVRMGEKVSYFEPNVPPYSLHSNSINGPFPGQFFRQPTKLMKSYDFVMVGRSRVSGRSAQQIRVVSKDKSRFGLNLWLDQETGLMLKMNMVDLKGQLLEQIQVTSLEVTETADPFFARIESAILPDVLKVRTSKPLTAKWQINYLPVGMYQVKMDVHRLPVTGESVEYLMLSDGLVDVSIYIRDVVPGTTSQDVLIRHESDTLLTRRQGAMNVTVIGKLPAATANNIANSIRRVN